MGEKPLIIGVAGGTGSGKTTIVNSIIRGCTNQRVILLQHDSYYKDRSHLSDEEKEKVNFDHPEALETSLLISHIRSLLKGESVEIPQYDFKSHTRKSETLTIHPAGIIIVEGILIFSDHELRGLMDIRIYVDTDDDIRLIRRLIRDTKERNRTMDSVIDQYTQTVRPMHLKFVEPSRKFADIIIPEGHNPIATDMVVSMIRYRIQSS